jgi:uncharacterized Fe-S cluster protein YjdI
MATGTCEKGSFTVFWDSTRCIRTGICLRSLHSVFNLKNRPWVGLDGGDIEQIIATVEKCPTGALRYSSGGNAQPAPDPTAMIPIPDGPLLVHGDLRVVDPETGRGDRRRDTCGAVSLRQEREPTILRQLPPPHPLHRRIPHRQERTRRCEVTSRHLPTSRLRAGEERPGSAGRRRSRPVPEQQDGSALHMPETAGSRSLICAGASGRSASASRQVWRGGSRPAEVCVHRANRPPNAQSVRSRQ